MPFVLWSRKDEWFVEMKESDSDKSTTLKEFVRQQRQTEEIALRLFRFKARRGVGVAYSFASIMVILTLIAAYAIHSVILTLILVAITPSIVIFGSGLFGYRGVARMNDAIGLISGKNRASKTTASLEILVVIALTWPWLVFTLLENFGYAGSAYIFPVIYVVELVILLIAGYRSRGPNTIDLRIEDIVFFASLCVASMLVINPAIGILSLEFALPVWILSGLKSLYDAPKEVLFEYESGRPG